MNVEIQFAAPFAVAAFENANASIWNGSPATLPYSLWQGGDILPNTSIEINFQAKKIFSYNTSSKRYTETNATQYATPGVALSEVAGMFYFNIYSPKVLTEDGKELISPAGENFYISKPIVNSKCTIFIQDSNIFDVYTSLGCHVTHKYVRRGFNFEDIYLISSVYGDALAGIPISRF